VEAVGTARLTDRIPAEHAVAASIPRREITDVLHDPEATPELTLDVVAGDGSREHGTVSITWARDELERLLEGTSGDDVVLTFDQQELMSAFDDVETHGLRARAAVFAVAAVGALGTTAAVANASEVGDASGGVAVATAPAYTDASSAGGYATPSQSDAAALAALQARSEAMNVQAAVGDAGSTGIVTDASTSGPATPVEPGAAAALHARSQAMDEQFGLTPADQAATQALEARGAAMNTAYGITADTGGTGIVTDASTGGGYATPPSASTGSGFEVQSPSTDDALIAGAALIAIAGAAFAARRGTLHVRH
jgi:trimeric autotransporter adhesin